MASDCVCAFETIMNELASDAQRCDDRRAELEFLRFHRGTEEEETNDP